MDSTDISSELLECLKLFNFLLLDDGPLQASSGMPKYPWIDELGRLRVWAANIGAHQKGLSSLDYRLRDASHIKTQIVILLRSLKRALQDLQEVLTALDMKDPLSREEHTRNQDGDDDGEDDDDDSTSEVEDIFLHIAEIISNLYSMSMLVRQPSQQDRLLRYRKDDTPGYEPFDRKHVLEKFPKAESSVIDNLGTAISNRRRDLKALERHRAKLAKGISHAHLDHHDGASTVMSGTLATDYKEEGRIARLEAESVSGDSATSYASSFLAGDKSIKVPAPPLGYGSEQPFECPYCFLITTADSRKSWARHVFRDLRPYLCVFPQCTTPTQMYDRRRDWFLHLQTNHLAPLNSKAVTTCPLCGRNDLLQKQLEHHLAAHLEQLALFALPRNMQDDEDDDVERDASTILEEAPVIQDEDSDASRISDEDYRFLNGDPDQKSPRSARLVGEEKTTEQMAATTPAGVMTSQEAVDAAYHANEGEYLTLISRIRSDMRRYVQGQAQPHDPKAHLMFKDPIGRKFEIPWIQCCRWKDMEFMITLWFAHVPGFAEPVKAGHYELFTSDDSRILPSEWESTIKPNMHITMKMRDELPTKQNQEKPLTLDDGRSGGLINKGKHRRR